MTSSSAGVVCPTDPLVCSYPIDSPTLEVQDTATDLKIKDERQSQKYRVKHIDDDSDMVEICLDD
jgi:hypothetical protein